MSRALDACYYWVEEHPVAGMVSVLLLPLIAALPVGLACRAHPLMCVAVLSFGAGRMRSRHWQGKYSLMLSPLVVGVVGGMVWGVGILTP